MNKLVDRYIILSVSYILIFTVIAIQLFNLQIIKGEEYNKESQRRLLRKTIIPAPRGNILDRNNVPVAVNRMGHSLLLTKTSISDQELNTMLYNIIKLLESNGDTYISDLNKRLQIEPFKFGVYVNYSEEATENWILQIAKSKKHAENLKTAEEVFEYLRNEKFNISQEYSIQDTYKIMEIRYLLLSSGLSKTSPVYIANDINEKTLAQIEERNSVFPGISVDVIPLRRYVDSEDLGHVVGYIGNITDDEYGDLKNKGYGINDLIGKTGIESKAEMWLRGIDGQKQIEMDINGRVTEVLRGRTPKSGNDVILTIDSRLQKVAMKSLETNINKIKEKKNSTTNFGDAFAGAAVAIDVNTGEVLVLASFPSYDPAVFIAPKDDKIAQDKRVKYLTDSKNSPMYNRAIRGTYIPGSIYKPITAIAGLEEGIIAKEDTLYDAGTYYIGNWKFSCLEYRLGYGAHGHLNLSDALKTSCNIYFHELGYKVGIDSISKWTAAFGLGVYTGIDIPGEAKGTLGDRNFKNTVVGENWYPVDTAQTAIGQMYNSFTPIQIANYVSTLANGGKKYRPYVIKKVIKSDGSIVSETYPEYERVPVKEETIEAVKEGMVAVTNSIDGTAVQAFKDFPFEVAGKTGTPETGGESRGISSNGVFIAYAPADKPEIAVAVVIERGVWGAYVAPVARDILQEYFGFNAKVVVEKEIEEDIAKLIP